MCMAGKDAGTPRVCKYNAVAERIAKTRIQRAMASAVRVNLNKYWDFLTPSNTFAGFIGSSWRKKLATVISESGIDQALPRMNTKNDNPPTDDEDMDAPEK